MGFGEPEPDTTALSGTTGPPLKVAGIPAVRDDRFRAWVKALIPDTLGSDCGEGGGSISPSLRLGVTRPGDDDSEPALKCWKDTDGLLAIVIPSMETIDALEACIAGLDLGSDSIGGELVSDPIVLTARRTDMGLDPRGGASPWNVDKLP